MTRLHIFSSRDNGREATGTRRLPVRVSWLLCCLLAVSLFTGFLPTYSAPPALAAQLEGEEVESFIDDPGAAASNIPSLPDKGGDDVVDDIGDDAAAGSIVVNDGISINLSEPETWQEGDTVFYKTALTVKGTETLFGYQIQIEAENEESIEIVDSFGGLKTKPVYKDGSVYFASFVSTQATTQTNAGGATSAQTSDDIATCEIIAKYPATDAAPDKHLVVQSFQVVKSLNPEAIITMGPNPSAAVLDWTPATESVASVAEDQMPVVMLALGILGASAAAVLLLRKRGRARSMGRHGAGLH